MEKNLGHSGSSERRRLDRMNALVRNPSHSPGPSDEEENNFRVEGGDDVTNILEKIGITRLDMLGISENDWSNRMSRPSSGELRYTGHPEVENPICTRLASSLRPSRSFEPSSLNESSVMNKPRRFSLDRHEESPREIKSREQSQQQQTQKEDQNQPRQQDQNQLRQQDQNQLRQQDQNQPQQQQRQQQTLVHQWRPQQLTLSVSSQESSSGSFGLDRGEAAESSFVNEGSLGSSSPLSQDDSTGEDVEDRGPKLEVDTRASARAHEDSPKTTRALTPRLSWSSWLKLDLLGSGSFGSVYRAVGSDGNFFAVKEVPLSNASDQSGLQLQQEIALLSHLRHENIVQYLGTQKGDDKLYIFLELVTQGSIVTQYKRFTLFEEQIRNYTRQILRGLNYLHEKKVVHRDIKCANILVHAHGTVKLADFGMAKQLEKMDSMKSCKGSVYWMAPEVINPKKTASFPADIWSLGCTVYEMATGKPPFCNWEWNTVFFNVGRGALPQIPDSIQGDTREFICECLQPDPLKRPTAAKLLEHPFLNPPVTTIGLVSEATEVVSAYDSWGVPARTDSGRSESVRTARSVRTRQSIFQNT